MSDPTVPPSDSADSPAHKPGGRVVVFQDQHEIFFDNPLPRYHTVGARAYLARSVRGGNEIAYVSERNAFPRLKFCEKYQGLQSSVPARLAARGVLRCPDGFERYVFIYENTLGQPLIPDLSIPSAYNMRPDIVITTVVRPILGLLQELQNMDLAHGAIRVDNLFDGGTQPIQSVRLGDGLSNAYLATQPALYLPINLAMAMPSGRGLETPIDDVYALGVTCALLVRAHDTTSKKTDEEIFLSKLEFGTFSTLIESERLPGNMLELLRGMLHDDPVVRWSVQDINDWFEGKRANRRSGTMRSKGSRHLNLSSHRILHPAVLSYYAPAFPEEMAQLVDKDEIRQWIRRSVNDSKLDARYEDAVESIREYIGSPSYQDRLACRVANAMEPDFPVAYQGLRFFPDSIGLVLAELLIAGRDPRPIIDLINDQMMIYWMNHRLEVPSDINLVINKFEQCQQFLKQKSIGYGIERCLYFLAPDIPCLSPNLRGYYVNTPERLLFALDQIGMMADRPARILDRHMIAFLAMRDRKLIDPYLPDLNSSEEYRQVTGTTSVLSAIQKSARIGPFPGLSRWVYDLTDPLYVRYHDRDLRTATRKKITDMRDQGFVSRMGDVLFDQEIIKRDKYDYRMATQEYYFLMLEKHALIEALKHKERYGIQTGREIAALLAGAITALAVVGFVLVRFSQGQMPW